ncbi:vomeronasal type-2 receptor 26 [Xenopus tropicalis]|uniref:Vomeronasal type-2 receptor 26 n=1 Tax=Xenopus tropicalis TaxID=8364 RepID=A0A8J1IS92_XENTR|nr:vomeronasal type-2 receptor 26 [Xenopus tropicalis]
MDPVFNDRTLFPSVYRTVPNEYLQFEVIVQLLIYFKWTWVGIVSSDDISNHKASLELIKEMKNQGICVEYHIVIPVSANNINHIVKLMQQSTATVIILYCTFLQIMNLTRVWDKGESQITGKVFVASVSLNAVSYIYMQSFVTLNGSLFISVHKGEIPGFMSYLSHRDWEQMPDKNFVENFKILLECFKILSNDSDSHCLLFKYWGNTNYITSVIYNTVHILAQALHQMHLDRGLFDTESKGLAAESTFKLNRYLKNVHLKTQSDEIFFNEQGSVAGKFDILNLIIKSKTQIRKVPVGSFVPSASPKLIINESAIVWNPYFNKTPVSLCNDICPTGYRKAIEKGKFPCCYDCIRCSEGEIASSPDAENCLQCPEDHWSNPSRDSCLKKAVDFLSYGNCLGMVLATAALLFSVCTGAVLWLFIKNRSSQIVKANNRNLSYILLVSLFLSFCCCFLFIGRPVPITCILRQTAFLFLYTVAISSLLGKTLTVVIAFHATKPGTRLRKFVGSRVSISLVLLCSLGKLAICSTWLIWATPFVALGTKTTQQTMTLWCNEGSIAAFCVAVSYTAVLALLSFIVAFMARKLPDRYNEAQHITFSMLVFFSVWVSFIPTYLSTKGKYMVAVEIFAILASTAGLLFCLSYGAMDPGFNDRTLFPSVYRTVPNEYLKFEAIVQLLIHFKWTWVGIVSSDDIRNHKASLELIKEMKNQGICVEYHILNRYLKNAYLKSFSDEIFFNEQGSVAGKFDILNFIESKRQMTKVPVGSFVQSASLKLFINESTIVWRPYFNKK